MVAALLTDAWIENLLPRLVAVADGRRVLDRVRAIVATDRWNSFDRFRETSRTIAAAFTEAGAAAECTSIPTGGHAGTGRWVVPRAMDIESATVDLVSPFEARLADYASNPWTVVQWCAPTPAAGILCDLCVADSDRELEQIPLACRHETVALTRQRLNDKHAVLADSGIAAVLCDAPVKELPEATLWGKFGWGGLPYGTEERNLPAFMLPQTAGARLRGLLAEGHAVRLRLCLRARYCDGEHPVVCGIVPGRCDPQDEVWAVAHSCEPGAVDNASGVAVCIEAAQVLTALIREGALPAPRRSIRFLAAMECYGFFEYLIRTKRLQPPLAGLVVDCVGARAELCDGTVTWHDTVPSSASFVNRLGLRIAEAAHRLVDSRWRVAPAPFASTEDTMLGDPRYGFPCPYVGSYPYIGYHSSGDTPEALDPESLRACVAAVAAYLHVLADGDTSHALEWAQVFSDHGVGGASSRVASSGGGSAALAVARREAEGARLARWFWGGTAADVRARLDAVLPVPVVAEDPPSRAADTGADHRIPFRRVPLAPTYENLPPEIRQRFRDADLHKWALYWADGGRTLEDIRVLASAERGREVSREQVGRFFEALDACGYVALVPYGETLGVEDLLAGLRGLGLRPGLDVMVHSSLSAIGWVRGGASTVIEALLQAIGPEGTLLLPSFHHRGAKVFNPLTTPTTNGAIADAFWRRPGVVRSQHPTHAVAAFGPKAEAWCRDHIEKGIWGPESPIGRLVHGGGSILGLGVDHTTTTAYHVAEVSLDVPCLDSFGSVERIVDASGTVREVPGLSWRNGTCPVSPRLLSPTLDERGLQRRGKVGAADCVFCLALDLWRVRREHLTGVCRDCPIRPRHVHPEVPARSGAV
ncbi:MAG: DUF4910 domain-containing protein [Lentisphaeria bacterium]|nr:DUF4910 domain-containing protein [Lentisphaeria bacterium]